MKRKLIIKSFRVSAKSKDTVSKVIVVGYNTSKVNGHYIEKLGTCAIHQDEFMYVLNLSRVAFWVNRGAVVKPRVSWIIGNLGKGLLVNVKKK